MFKSPILGLVFLIVGLLWVLTILGRGSRHPRGKLPYYSKGSLLSQGELAFFTVFKHALQAGLLIAPKVRVSDVLGCSRKAWKDGFGNRVSQKHLDFMVVDERTTAFIFAVELDDKTHLARDRTERDEFVDRALEGAGIPILRFRAAAKYDIADIRAKINASVDSLHP